MSTLQPTVPDTSTAEPAADKWKASIAAVTTTAPAGEHKSMIILPIQITLMTLPPLKIHMTLPSLQFNILLRMIPHLLVNLVLPLELPNLYLKFSLRFQPSFIWLSTHNLIANLLYLSLYPCICSIS